MPGFSLDATIPAEEGEEQCQSYAGYFGNDGTGATGSVLKISCHLGNKGLQGGLL